MDGKKRILTGIRPTGALHLGHYAADMGLVRDALADGTARARQVAQVTMAEVREALDLGYLDKFRAGG